MNDYKKWLFSQTHKNITSCKTAKNIFPFKNFKKKERQTNLSKFRIKQQTWYKKMIMSHEYKKKEFLFKCKNVLALTVQTSGGA